MHNCVQFEVTCSTALEVWNQRRGFPKRVVHLDAIANRLIVSSGEQPSRADDGLPEQPSCVFYTPDASPPAEHHHMHDVS